MFEIKYISCEEVDAYDNVVALQILYKDNNIDDEYLEITLPDVTLLIKINKLSIKSLLKDDDFVMIGHFNNLPVELKKGMFWINRDNDQSLKIVMNPLCYFVFRKAVERLINIMDSVQFS